MAVRAAVGTPVAFHPPCGPITGWTDRDAVRATGIPYARSERFAPPRPLPDHDEPLAATSWAPAAPQNPAPFLDEVLGRTEVEVDEHCQRLSITRPRDLADGELLPVMVWIHGGSYVAGAGDLSVMDPYLLVTEQRVVVVTVTYRLGVLGYLGDDRRPANLGLLDQIEALRWVRRNIAAFGGDPGRVTAFGQSAGGDAVAHLLVTPGAAALVQRAIVQSAPLGIARGRARMTAAMGDVAAHLDRDTPLTEVLATQTAAAAAAGRFGLPGLMPFGTQYGRWPLPSEGAVDQAWRLVAPAVPLLIGATAQEAQLFVDRLPRARRVWDLPVIGEGLRRAVVAGLTSLVYARPADRFARRQARAGGVVHRFTIDWRAPGNRLGSAHTVDLPMLFGEEPVWRDAALTAGSSWPEILDAGRRVRAVWGAFAHGRPLPERSVVPGVLRVRRVR